MKYTNFHIKNFKGIKELNLNLAPDHKLNIFTLVGLNESGKTTVLEAMDFFQKDIPNDKRHTLIPKNKKLNFNGTVSVKATLELLPEDEKILKEYAREIGFNLTQDIKTISFEKGYAFQNSKFHEIKASWEINLVGSNSKSKKIKSLSSSDAKWFTITNHIKDELFPPIIYYPNFLFDFPVRIYLEKREGESPEQEFYRKVLQDILDSLGEDLNLERHILNRLKSSEEEDKEALNSAIQKISSKITATVFKTWQQLFKSKGKQIIVRADKEVRDGEDPRYYIEIKLKEGSDEYLISERSLGFKWFFAFLLFTEFRKNRSNDKGQILFLLDEPASNLHSTAQMKLLDTLESLAEKSKLIYTTHSHHLISSKWLEGAYIVQNKALDYDEEFEYDASQTDIEAILYRKFVAESPNQQTYFQPILDSLDYKPSVLEQVPELIIVEGKYDFYILKYVNEVILNNKFKINFYPGNGAGKNNQVIKLYLSWSRNFLVLMDADEAGINAKAKYLEEFGKILEGKVIVLSDIEKKWKGWDIERLFSEEEQMRIVKSLYPEASQFSKERFNISIQNLLFFGNKISLSSNTKKRFEKVFNNLNQVIKKQK